MLIRIVVCSVDCTILKPGQFLDSAADCDEEEDDPDVLHVNLQGKDPKSKRSLKIKKVN